MITAQTGGHRESWLLGAAAAGLLVASGLLAAVGMGVVQLGVAVGVLVGIAMVSLTALRPVIGLVLVAVAVPLMAGLGKDTLVPVFRPSEVVTVAVLVGFGLNLLWRWPVQTYSWMDLGVFAYTLGGVLVPWLVLYLQHQSIDIATWRTITGPLQFLAIYLLYSRTPLKPRELRALLTVSLTVGILVALVGVLQLADIAGVRAFLATYYIHDIPNHDICQYGVCRPTSFLEYWSPYGGFAALNFLLALSLASRPAVDVSRLLLTAALGANACAVIVSQTQAAVIGILVGGLVLILHSRRVPREMQRGAVVVLLVAVLFWPQIQSRYQQQFGLAGSGQAVPESLDTRYRYWEQFFVPVATEHIFVGTGTLVPPEVPARLTTYVDNEYLGVILRGGLVALSLLLIAYVTLIGFGWRSRRGPPYEAGLGGALMASTVALAIMGTTAEYLTYGGVSQEYWMIAGLAAGTIVVRSRSPAPVDVVTVRSAAGELPLIHERAVFVPIARLGRGLVGAAAILLAGNIAARLLGFLFSLAVAKLLAPSEYGLFAYALVISSVSSVLMMNAPSGLGRYLSRGSAPLEKGAYLRAALALTGGLLIVSSILTVILARAAGLGPALVAGVLANLLGVTIFQFYRAMEWGLGRFAHMATFYVLANVVQLAVVLVMALAGVRDAGLFLVVYGLSNVVALALIWPFRDRDDKLWTSRFTMHHVGRLVRFTWPLLLQSAFYAVWFGADLALVKWYLPGTAAGNYAAAKTLVNVMLLAPAAITAVTGPSMVSLSRDQFGRAYLRLIGVALIVTAPALLFILFFGQPLLHALFGSKFSSAAQAVPALAVGMALYGVYVVLAGALAIGFGRSRYDAAATAAGMITTIVLGLIAVPRLGLSGAAIAFCAGSAVQLLVLNLLAVSALRVDRPTQTSSRDPLMAAPSPLTRIGALTRIALRRQVDDLRTRARSTAYITPGFAPRPTPAGRVIAVDKRVRTTPRQSLERRLPTGVVAGRTIPDDSAALAQAAVHYGIEARLAPISRTVELLRTARKEAWPLVGISLGGVLEIPGGVAPALRNYLVNGGVAIVGGITPASNALALELIASTGLVVPPVDALEMPAAALLFSGIRADLCFELAGTRMEVPGLAYAFAAPGAGEVAAVETRSGVRAVLIERDVGLGRLLMVAGPDSIEGPFAESLAAPGGICSLAPMMALRREYGDTAWEPPFRFANFTIDDPALRNDFVGLDYQRALSIAEESDFHLTVATIPYELRWAQADVVHLLHQRNDRLSACYHGYRHDGYEFYLPEAVGTKWRPRPLVKQFDALRRGVREGVRLATRYPGYALDRVMVFPHGICTVPVLTELGRLGFLATSNASDRLPLGAVPLGNEIGLRPADVNWGGFPIIWRRDISDPSTFAFDLFLGRPAIAFSHRRALGDDMTPFRERAETINRLGGSSVRWTRLETIANNAFVQRRVSPADGWEVLMFGNEIKLQNPGQVERYYSVRRADLPPGGQLVGSAAGGVIFEKAEPGSDALRLSLPPKGTASIRLHLKDTGTLPVLENQSTPAPGY